MIAADLSGKPSANPSLTESHPLPEVRLFQFLNLIDGRRCGSFLTVVLSQLPCWRHLSAELYRKLVAGLLREIDAMLQKGSSQAVSRSARRLS